MKKMFCGVWNAVFYAGCKCRSGVRRAFSNQEGMGTIEIIIIIAVLVTLALLFRNFIMDLADGIFDKIQEKTDIAITNL